MEIAKLRIVSRSYGLLHDRREAGQLLARELRDLRGQKAVVLGIPRGGVVVAHELARALEADLDIVLAHKMRTPGHPELALGAVAEGGNLFLNQRIVQELSIQSSYIERERVYQEAQLAHRASLIRRVLPKIPLEGRLVVVTDDGVATGATAQAALWAARHENPKKLIVAMPVGSEEAVTRLAEDADEVVCLRVPPGFTAVGQFYVRFDEVSDDDVLAILEEERLRRGDGKP